MPEGEANILREIIEHKKLEIVAVKNIRSLDTIKKEVVKLYPEIQEGHEFKFAEKLRKVATENAAIIAEVKRKSPSKGIICKDFDHLRIAELYTQNGAACISILTDEKYFGGCAKFLQEIRKQTALPLLRKDFFIDEYQIYEAKLLGADCILLIMAALNLDEAKNLEALAHSLGLDVLIEVHNEVELEQALQLNSKLIGVNNRDLKKMITDVNTSRNLAKIIPHDYIKISESGIFDAEVIADLYQNYGFGAFLIGESLTKDLSQTANLLRKFTNF